ncbi:MAG: hypothetical protein WA652_11695 [Xanthobacteraceae bacterium]
MLRSIVSRIRLFLIVLGCAILGASLFDWAQGLRATEDGPTWVGLNSSSAPAIDTAEIWQVSANCVRPFFVKALLRSKAQLKDYYDSVPEDVRAWRSRAIPGESSDTAADQAGLYRLVDDRPAGRRHSVAAQEHGAMLHAQYAEWYANVFKLELRANQWEQRLQNVADERVTLGEATRKSFMPYPGSGIEHAGSKSNFDQYVLGLLGLGGFSVDQEQALRTGCISILPVKKIARSVSFLRELWRWPVEQAAAFSFGLELVCIGILFVPIALWIGTGDAAAIKRYIRDAVDRCVIRARYAGIKLMRETLRILGAIFATTRAIFTARTNPGRAVGEIPFVAKLAEIRFGRYAPHIRSLTANKKFLHICIEWPKRGGSDYDDGRELPGVRRVLTGNAD